MSHPLLNQILTNTYTKQELMRRVRILRAYVEKSIFTEGTPEFEDEIVQERSWIQSLHDTILSQITKDNFKDEFDQLEQELQKIPVLIMYLPFEVDTQTSASIGELLRRTYGETFVYDAKYNPNLIAGCALVWKGRYKDYSLKAAISTHKEEIIKNIKQSLHIT